jgi:hypothetical protein
MIFAVTPNKGFKELFGERRCKKNFYQYVFLDNNGRKFVLSILKKHVNDKSVNEIFDNEIFSVTKLFEVFSHKLKIDCCEIYIQKELMFCENLLIYLNQELPAKKFELIYSSSREVSYLIGSTNPVVL